MTMRIQLSNWFATVALFAGLASPANAQTVADFYKDRPVTLITGYSSGGGFDLYTRVVANHLGRHIPGNPRIIVQNMPGAGSTRAAGHLYNVAPKDGTVIALARAPVIEPLVGTGGGSFDTTKFTWLGSGASDLTVCGLLGNPRVKTMADATQHEVTLGGLGPGSDEDMYAKILRKLFGLKSASSADIQAAPKWSSLSNEANWTAAAAGLFRVSRYRSRNGLRIRKSDSSM